MRDKVKIIENGKGAVLTILDDDKEIYGVVDVQQQEQVTEVTPQGKRLQTYLRNAKITGNLRDMVHVGYLPNERLCGHIVVRDSTEPIFTDDPEHGLLWRNGVVARTEKGEAIYRTSYYSENGADKDELLINP